MSATRSRRVLVTGAASGIGLETSLQLAGRGAHVILADRNVAGGEAALRRIVDAGGSGEFRELDLADLARIRDFATAELARDRPLDVLINDAGLLPPMLRATTRDGFELEFGVAHLAQMAGVPGAVRPSRRALDTVVAARLWEASEQLSGVRYEWPAPLRR